MLSAADRLLRVPVFPQDPFATPEPVLVEVRGDLLPGPVGDRVAVYDFNRDRDEVYPPASPDDADFPVYAADDFRFHQLAAYTVAARAIDVSEGELGRDLTWSFDASRLIVLPHAGRLANAFYSDRTRSLQLYSFWSEHLGAVYHTCLCHDIVAHEVGHAILDAVRPRFVEALELDTAALHEAVGDLAATFAALTHDVAASDVASRPTSANLVTEIAEGFEPGAPIRSLLGPPGYDWEAVREPHDRSLWLTRAVYAGLVAMMERARAQGRDPPAALRLARRALQRIAVRALDWLPPADATLADYARALVAADAMTHPGDDLGFRSALAGALVAHGVLASASVEPPDPTAWRDVPRSWPRLSPREAYVFLDRNRGRLALSTHAGYRDFVVRDCFATRRPGTDAESDSVVAIYEYPVDVQLSGADYGAADGSWLTIWGGGTLVFDPQARLFFHAEKPVTRQRIQGALAFVRTELAAHRVAALRGNAVDDVRQHAARQRWLLELERDRAALRGNPAARCHVGPRHGGGR